MGHSGALSISALSRTEWTGMALNREDEGVVRARVDKQALTKDISAEQTIEALNFELAGRNRERMKVPCKGRMRDGQTDVKLLDLLGHSGSRWGMSHHYACRRQVELVEDCRINDGIAGASINQKPRRYSKRHWLPFAMPLHAVRSHRQ
jgi:hypothetical protein